LHDLFSIMEMDVQNRRVISDEDEEEENTTDDSTTRILATEHEPEEGERTTEEEQQRDVVIDVNEIPAPQSSFLQRLKSGVEDTTWWQNSHQITVLYAVAIDVALLTILIVDWDTSCDKPIKSWSAIEIVLQTIVLFVNAFIVVQYPAELPRDMYNRRRTIIKRINLSICSIAFVWLLYGMFLTFSSETCVEKSPFMYRLLATIFIFQLIFGGFFLFLFILYAIALKCNIQLGAFEVDNFMSGDSPRSRHINPGASREQIDSLVCKKFSPTLFSSMGLEETPDQRWMCAICLLDYEDGDDVRFLNCKPVSHHYHKKCIDQWLSTYSKACPMCKRSIHKTNLEAM